MENQEEVKDTLPEEEWINSQNVLTWNELPHGFKFSTITTKEGEQIWTFIPPEGNVFTIHRTIVKK